MGGRTTSWVAAIAATVLLATPAWAGDPDLKPIDLGASAAEIDITASLTVVSGIRYGGITVFPVVDSDAPKIDADRGYFTLSDALSDRSLTVSELGAGGSVASLRVHNTGKRPVLVMAGEVIYGGSQDRIITEDVVIPPTDLPIAVNVNCVERGRWSETDKHFAYGGRAELGLRRVVQVERSQDATWRTVSHLNTAKGAAPSTGTYMASMRTVDRRADKVTTEIVERLAKVHDVVGVVVAVDGRIVASELYRHPELFARVREGTIAAVARDGISSGVIDAQPAAVPTSLAASFLGDAVRGSGLTPGPRAEVHGDDTLSYVLRDHSGEVVHMATYSR